MDYSGELEPNIKIEEDEPMDEVVDPYRDKQFSCNICSHNCQSFADMKTHIQQNHEGRAVAVVKCPMCEKGFHSQSYLNTHVQTVHEKKKPFACDLCKKNFGQKSSLNLHVRTQHKGFSFSE